MVQWSTQVHSGNSSINDNENKCNTSIPDCYFYNQTKDHISGNLMTMRVGMIRLAPFTAFGILC